MVDLVSYFLKFLDSCNFANQNDRLWAPNQHLKPNIPI